MKTWQRYRFKKWRSITENHSDTRMIEAKEYDELPEGADMDNFQKNFRKRFAEKIEMKKNPSAAFNLPRGYIEINGKGPFVSNAYDISLVPEIGITCCIKNIGLQFLSLRNKNDHGYARIVLENCYISDIRIWTDATEIDIRSCVIGHLEFYETSQVRSLNIFGSYIERLEFPPFSKVASGNVNLENTYFERNLPIIYRIFNKGNLNSYFKYSAQTYRNMRRNLLDLDNVRAASIVNATEMSISRKQHRKGIMWATSSIYELLSDYGNSISRPISWFLFIFFISVLEILKFVTFTSNGVLKNCTTSSANLESSNSFIKAILLEFSYLRNPFYFLDQHRRIIDSHIYFSFILAAENIFALLTLTLMIIALRRHYKLSS